MTNIKSCDLCHAVWTPPEPSTCTCTHDDCMFVPRQFKKRTVTGLTRATEATVERRFAALREAEVLLDLVAAEFASDPMSVQCFDLRVVERVKACAKVLRDNPNPFRS